MLLVYMHAVLLLLLLLVKKAVTKHWYKQVTRATNGWLVWLTNVHNV